MELVRNFIDENKKYTTKNIEAINKKGKNGMEKN